MRGLLASDARTEAEALPVLAISVARKMLWLRLPARIVAPRCVVARRNRSDGHSRHYRYRISHGRRRRRGRCVGYRRRCAATHRSTRKGPNGQTANQRTGNGAPTGATVPASARATAPVTTRRRRRTAPARTAPSAARMRLGSGQGGQCCPRNKGQSEKKFCYAAHRVPPRNCGRKHRSVPSLRLSNAPPHGNFKAASGRFVSGRV